MNLRNNRVNTVHVPQKKQRNIYTEMEEARMWWFFARELRSSNQDALKRRPKLWRMYEEQEDTEKKMYGLESHFRKYMRKKIHLAEMFKEDMFLCLRFFKIRLNKRQREGLEKRFGCTIDCDVDGTFRSAHFQAGDDAFTLPTAEEEATILEDIEADDQNDDDEEEEDDPNYTNRHVRTPKVEPEEEGAEGQGSQTRKRRKTRRSDEDDGKAPSNARPSDQHHANSSGAEDSSDDVAILWEKRRAEGAGQQQEGGGGSQTSNGPEIELMEGGGEEGQNGEGGNEGDDQRGSRKSDHCVLEIRPEDDKMEKARDELAEGEEYGLDRSVDYAADETDIAEENRRNSEVTTGHGSTTLPGTSAPTTTQGGMSIVERQAALASVKKAFINGRDRISSNALTISENAFHFGGHKDPRFGPRAANRTIIA